jgi:alginate O-acetyltransferase complex protein AlgI
LLTVFLLCGLWHGANWTFVLWGLYHGLFLSMERVGLKRLLDMAWRPFRHAYALLVVLLSWVLFRSENLAQAGLMYSTMFTFCPQPALALPVQHYFTGRIVFALLFGLIASTPILSCIVWSPSNDFRRLTPAFRFAAVTCILALSMTELAAGSYNPFIYFRF